MLLDGVAWLVVLRVRDGIEGLLAVDFGGRTGGRTSAVNVGDTGIKSEAWSRSGSPSYLTTQQTRVV